MINGPVPKYISDQIVFDRYHLLVSCVIRANKSLYVIPKGFAHKQVFIMFHLIVLLYR